jgi:hypothetical protein
VFIQCLQYLSSYLATAFSRGVFRNSRRENFSCPRFLAHLRVAIVTRCDDAKNPSLVSFDPQEAGRIKSLSVQSRKTDMIPLSSSLSSSFLLHLMVSYLHFSYLVIPFFLSSSVDSSDQSFVSLRLTKSFTLSVVTSTFMKRTSEFPQSCIQHPIAPPSQIHQFSLLPSLLLCNPQINLCSQYVFFLFLDNLWKNPHFIAQATLILPVL